MQNDNLSLYSQYEYHNHALLKNLQFLLSVSFFVNCIFLVWLFCPATPECFSNYNLINGNVTYNISIRGSSIPSFWGLSSSTTNLSIHS